MHMFVDFSPYYYAYHDVNDLDGLVEGYCRVQATLDMAHLRLMKKKKHDVFIKRTKARLTFRFE